MHRLRYAFLILALVIPLSLFAQDLPPSNPANFSGEINVGSAPVLFEVTDTLGLRFTLDGFLGEVLVTEYDTVQAIQLFCAGQLDIVLIDRQITPQEANACNASGRSPLGFRIGSKSVSVAVSPLNKFVDSLTTSELQQIFSGAPVWSDVRPDWTGELIGRYGSGTTSLEVAYFAQAVFGGETNAMTTALGAQYNDDPNIALNEVAISEFAIGIFDSSFLNQNRDFVRTVPIDGIEGNVFTIANSSYPLARPLLLYSSASIMQASPQVAEFIKYYLENLDFELPAVNLFPADVPTQQIAINTWLSATGQEVTPPIVVPTEAPPPAATEEVIDPVPDDTVVEPIDREPTPAFASDVLPLLINARTDLEVMATEVLGISRPPGWSGSLDINDPQLALLARLDLELLAAIVYGERIRPEDWFGAVGSSQLAIVRDIRHDLEIMADNIYSGARPADWAGGDPIYRCSRSTQALAGVLQRSGLYTITADPALGDYCRQVEIEVSRFAEVNLIGESSIVLGQSGEALDINREAEITTEFAVAFLTRFAEPQVGIMPLGTPITPVARSYATGSNMTLIEGNGFRVFIEFTNTSMSEDQWEQLPDIDNLEEIETFCDADWCR